MKRVLAALNIEHPASLKRFLTTLFTAVTLLAINPFLQSRGLPTLDDATLVTVAGLVAAYLLQSGVNTASDIKATAMVDAAKASASAPAPAPGPEVKP